MRTRTAALLGFCLFAAACSSEDCLLWGCDDDVYVKLASPVTSSSYTIELLVDGAQPGTLPGPKTVTCNDTTPCGLEPVKISAMMNNKNKFSVRVTTEAGSKVTEFASVSWTSKYKDNCHDCRSVTVTTLAP